MEAVTVVQHARVVAGPRAEPQSDATVVMRDGVVAAIERQLPIPPGATVVDGAGGTLVPGFWNTHVHLTGREFAHARRRSTHALDSALADLLTSHGFTTAADLSSDPRNTLAVVRRVESGEVTGPRIHTAGSGLYPPRGLPFYIRESVPRHLWWAIPTPRTPAGARRVVRRQLGAGADLTKLFTGSYVTPTTIKPMPLEVARAAVELSHHRGVLVFAHTSDRHGLRIALDAGVDVIAHVPDETEGVAPLLRRAADSGVVMVPTFQMFASTVTDAPSYLDPILEAARVFLDAGGRMMFGTDVGYLSDPTIDGELGYLARCGLGASDVLAMLTTTPAEVFGVAGSTGRLVPGLAADAVVLDGDPWSDPTTFARVRTTIRGGKVIWPLTAR